MSEKNEFNQAVGVIVENWSSAERPAKVNLQGRFCILEPLDIEKHAVKLFESLSINNQGESWTYLPYGPFDSSEHFQSWLKKTMSDTDTFLYAIVNIETQLSVGICGFLRINPEHGVIEIGHVHFSNLLKKTPAATEALYLMMRYAFDELKYRRCEWKCHSLNQASRNAALRLGFTFEGIFRQSNIFKSRNRDTAWFSIIDSEWPKIDDKLKKWLSPGNFDDDGKQMLSLSEI